jgi:predicted Abi (CAAX) family protease
VLLSVPSPSEPAPTFSQVEKALLYFTPLAAALAGYLTSWIAANFPGLNIPADQLTALFIFGGAAVVFLALKVLDSIDKRVIPLAPAPATTLTEAQVIDLFDQRLRNVVAPLVAQSLRDRASTGETKP